jgi:hypothetical protein
MSISKIDFYNALKSAVMFSPGEGCNQLQTFKVLEQSGGAKLVSENFGATRCDKDKPYFWSRKWHNQKYAGDPDWAFPALIVVERSFVSDHPFRQSQNTAYQFNISVMDRLHVGNNKMGCTGCEGRTINEIYEDTERLLFQTLQFIGGTIEASIDGVEGLYNKDMLEAMVANGDLSAYVPGKFWGSLVSENIKGTEGYKSAIYQEQIFGNSINISLPFKICDKPDWNFGAAGSLPVFLPDTGCKTCG